MNVIMYLKARCIPKCRHANQLYKIIVQGVVKATEAIMFVKAQNISKGVPRKELNKKDEKQDGVRQLYL